MVLMSLGVKKITVNVPAETLERAMAVTGQSLTATIIAGLEELQLKAKRSALRSLRGKVHFNLDLTTTRR